LISQETSASGEDHTIYFFKASGKKSGLNQNFLFSEIRPFYEKENQPKLAL